MITNRAPFQIPQVSRVHFHAFIFSECLEMVTLVKDMLDLLLMNFYILLYAWTCAHR